MEAPILNFDDLRKASRLGPRATLARVERWARGAGIKYLYDGAGGIFTTIDAVNAALGLSGPDSTGPGGMYTPDMV